MNAAVEDSVEDLPNGMFARTPARVGGWQQRGKAIPFGVGKIGRVATAAHIRDGQRRLLFAGRLGIAEEEKGGHHAERCDARRNQER
ncbi:hypothetical protein BH24ACT20_BH24ACT20_14710 [soil metagenome]